LGKPLQKLHTTDHATAIHAVRPVRCSHRSPLCVQSDGLCQRAHACPCTGDYLMPETQRSLSSVVRGTHNNKEGSVAPVRNAIDTTPFLHLRASHSSRAPCCDATTAHEGSAGCERSRMPPLGASDDAGRSLVSSQSDRHPDEGSPASRRPRPPYDRPTLWTHGLSSAPDNQRRLLDGAYCPIACRKHHLTSRQRAHLYAVRASMWGDAPPLSTPPRRGMEVA